MADELGDLQVNIVPDLSDFADNIEGDLEAAANAIAESVASGVDAGVQQATDSIDLGGFTDTFATAGDLAGVDMTEAMADSVGAGMGDVADQVTTELDEVAAQAAETLGNAGAEGGEALSEGITSGTSGVADAAGAVGSVAGAAFAGYFGVAALRGYEEDIMQIERLRLGLAKAGFEGENALQPYIDSATAFSRETGIMDEVILKLQATLMNLGKSFFETLGPKGAQEVLNDLTQAMLDMSAGTGKPLQMFMRSLGPKILNSPERAVTQLEQLNVLTAEQVARVKDLTAAGKKEAATMFIITKMQERYNGQAAAAATPMKRLSEVFDEISDAVGKVFSPALDQLVTMLQNMPPLITASVVALGSFATAAIVASKVWSIFGGSVMSVLGPTGIGGAVVSLGRTLLTVLVPSMTAASAAAAPLLLTLGAVAAAAAVVAGAGYLIYKNWDTVGPVVEDAGKALLKIGKEIWKALEPVVKDLGGALMDAFKSIAGAIDTLWDAVGPLVIALWKLVAPVAAFIAKIYLWIQVQFVVTVFKALAEVVGWVGTAFEFLKDVWDAILPGLVGGVVTFVNVWIHAVNTIIVVINALIRTWNKVPFHEDTETIDHIKTLDAATLGWAESTDEATEAVEAETKAVKEAAVGHQILTQNKNRALNVIDRYNEFLGNSIDLSKTAGQNIEAEADAYRAWGDQAAGSMNFVQSALGDLMQKQNLSAEGIHKALQKQLADMKKFGANLKTIAQDGGAGAEALVQELLAAGPAGAAMAETIANATPKARAAIERDIGKALNMSQDSAKSLEKTLTGGFKKIAAAILVATGEADTFQDALDTLDGTTVQPTIDLQLEKGIYSRSQTDPPKKKARGGRVRAGELSLVGEEGPELFASDTAGTIIPNNKIGLGGGGPAVIRITGFNRVAGELDGELSWQDRSRL